MLNTAKIGTLASNGTAPSTKGVVGRKEVDVSIRKVICTKDKHETDCYLCNRVHNWLRRKESKALSSWKG